MSSVKPFYAIVDYAGHRGTAVEYVNESTTGLNDIWMSMVPVPYKQKDIPTPPAKFPSREEAEPYLDKIKAKAILEWDNNSHWYRMYGRARPQWKIYKFKEGDLDFKN
jgi:hypothetical protein